MKAVKNALKPTSMLPTWPSVHAMEQQNKTEQKQIPRLNVIMCCTNLTPRFSAREATAAPLNHGCCKFINNSFISYLIILQEELCSHCQQSQCPYSRVEVLSAA